MKVRHFFRADKTNVGDWWCPPIRYFPLPNHGVYDLVGAEKNNDFDGLVVLGGGGLGAPFFKNHLESLLRTEREYRVVVWGVGEDVFKTSGEAIKLPPDDMFYTGFLDSADIIGSRVFKQRERYSYVPCASCMNPLFFRYREVVAKKFVGIYFHKRAPLDFRSSGLEDSDHMDNSGSDMEEKLKFLSRYEYIVTNTYHGVYWATLLAKKVICIPFKSGLYSFKDAPSYSLSPIISDDIIHQARSFPDSLEECRKINTGFFERICEAYSIC